MYKLLLILKYLRRKLAPLFAAVAVMLCTAMVIIVMSVMGGFLDEFRRSAKNLTGDVIVEGPLQGFAGYEELLGRIESLPEIEQGTPVIETFGLINFRDNAKPVRIQGVDLADLEQIVGYKHTLVWTPDELLAPMREFMSPDSDSYKRLETILRREHPVDPTLADRAEGNPAADAALADRFPPRPEMLIGIEVNPYQYRDETGAYSLERSWAMAPAVLTVVPLTSSGTVGTQREQRQDFVVVNEFKSGLYDIDGSYVFVPFGTLQRMLAMEERTVLEGVDPETGLGGTEVTKPGRANRLVLKAAPGIDVNDARAAVQETIGLFYAERDLLGAPPRALTWEDVHGQILGAVQNEKGLVTFLFGVIGIVAVVMVATTFYMIVLEKTRDIGVLRAIGASRLGIMQMFLGYGLAIGIVGSVLGLVIAAAIVTNLNEIQELIAATTGWRMWNPQTYFFDRIPDRVNYTEAGRVVVGAIVSSVIGATLPALLAARLKPVEALRYE
ncbi:MAG: FtsX-like permease family protein [Planctomycetota bacterium]